MSRRSRTLTVARAAVLAVALAAVLTGVGACTVVSRPPGPDETAGRLAEGLTAGDLTRVAFTGATGESATASVRNAVGALGQTPRSVSVAALTPAGDQDTKATATLEWRWDLDSGPTDWVYRTEAALVRAEDKSWQVTWSPALVEKSLAATERLAVDRVLGPRGEILGSDGDPLVTLRDVYRVGVDKGRIPPEQAAASAGALAALVGVDAAAYTATVQASGPKQFVVAITLRVDDPRIAGKTAQVQAIPGAAAIPDQAMLAPTATFARPLLGSVGPATAELVEKSGGRIGPTDTVGLSGLQRQYDLSLTGTPGMLVRATGTDAGGAATNRTLFTLPPVPGAALRTTLDRDAQNAAEATLAAVPVPSALVALRPSTGEVIAAANGPATTAGTALATSGRSAPGSTFKVVSALALLRRGLTPDSPVSCTPSVTVDGRVFSNYSDFPAGRFGTLPLRTALALSCNTAFISQHAVVSQDDLADAAAALGVGVDWDTGFPAFVGSVPRAATATEHAASMIGQGKVTMSALAMATVAASVVSGKAVVPHLVERPTSPAAPTGGATAGSSSATGGAPQAGSPAATGSVGAPSSASGSPSGATTTSATTTTATAAPTTTPLPTAPPAPVVPLTPTEADALRSMMATVVSEGSGRVLGAVGAGGAKTGTAEYGTTVPPRTHAWMIAYRGDLAVAVYVEDGQSGSVTAGPLAKAFLAAYAG